MQKRMMRVDNGDGPSTGRMTIEMWHSLRRQLVPGPRGRDTKPHSLVIPLRTSANLAPASGADTEALLAQLEAENAALRHRAVELALQIQELSERPR
jgi:hypothetical protein